MDIIRRKADYGLQALVSLAKAGRPCARYAAPAKSSTAKTMSTVPAVRSDLR